MRVDQYIAMVNRKLENEEIGRFDVTDARRLVADTLNSEATLELFFLLFF
jgi:hypothetical protein